MTEFRQIVLDLEDAKQPMNGIFQKTMFLSKIKDRDYDHIKDSCMEYKGSSFPDSIAKMESKWKTLHPNNKNATNSPPTPHQVNLLTADQVIKLSIEDQIKHGWLCPKKKWTTMSFKDKMKFKKERNNKFGYITKAPGSQPRQQIPSPNYANSNQLVTALCTL